MAESDSEGIDHLLGDIDDLDEELFGRKKKTTPKKRLDNLEDIFSKNKEVGFIYSLLHNQYRLSAFCHATSSKEKFERLAIISQQEADCFIFRRSVYQAGKVA
ncbi:unnamed protein product [Toxocara canis]|uniref:DNA helicase n=1 Tax=Toxocara canis TaxID=6265 RepID=A0A183UG12_TOXCA|nr:unnamed protein product [Toxocara canis]